MDSDILAMKCVKAWLDETVCAFLRAWLLPRSARVIVQGQQSNETRIANQVYQRTVLVPPLRNVYFAGVSEFAAANGFVENKF